MRTLKLDVSNWFLLESTAQQAAPLSIALAPPDSNQAIARLPLSDLELLKNILQSTWRRLGRGNHPASLTDDSLDDLIKELRGLIRARALEARLPAGTSRLRLPPLDHPWCTDDDYTDWWFEHLFANTHRQLLRTWLDENLEQGGAIAASKHAWLRTLLHRVTLEEPTDSRLRLLRELYGATKAASTLIDHDERFAATFDLGRFGGPWSAQLGIQRAPKRRRPFSIPKPRPPRTDAADVTVLIPSYRHGKYIGKTLRSVLGQSYAEHRILVADDRSPDNTIATARRVKDPRITVRVNERNLGLGNSVLKALDAIDTPFVAILNSDDLLHPEHLETCRQALVDNPSRSLVATDLTLIDPKDGHLDHDNASLIRDGKKIVDWTHWFARSTPPEDLPPERQFEELLQRNYLITSSNMFARTDWLREQADSLRSLKYCLDWRLFLEAARTNQLVHIRKPLVAYRLHPSNTVWFEHGRRHTYFLEVNRVAADALKSFVGERSADPEVLERVVRTVVENIESNSEVKGSALLLNTLLDGLALDHAASESEQLGALIDALSRATPADGPREDHSDQQESEERQQILGRLAQETSQIERNRRKQAEEQTRRLVRDIEKTGQHLEETKHQLDHSQEEAALLRDSLQDARRTAATVEELRKLIQSDLASSRKQQDRLAQDRDQLKNGLARTQARVESLEHELATARERLDDLRKQLETAQANRQQAEATARRLTERQEQMHQLHQQMRERHELQQTSSRAAHERHSAQLRARSERAEADRDRLRSEKQKLSSVRNELTRKVKSLHEEVDSLRKTREFRTGNFFWNKLPFAYMSRRGKKWYRRLVDAKNRARMLGSRLFSRNKKSQGTAIVAACWQWPIYSHTFVYQEMLSLTHMGLDVQLFHWDLGSTDQLHNAFRYLYEHRTQLQPVWENHERDKRHFEKTKPGRLRSLLEKISPLCGKPVEDLEKEPIVLQACTFARMAEMAEARYIHSYFFYDQSFMAMVAAWLLELPRGVSCYADHMMDDYEWKFVPLHVELCDVIVATSARIKSELSELSGGRFDDKIIVKPNGVDGERFPARQRPARKVEDPFEVISVSRIEPKKGLTYMVEAIAMLRERGHKVIAHIIGSKDEHSKGSLEYAAQFEQAIKDHNLEDQIILHGMMKQEEMPPIIEKSRAFVAPYIETESGDKDGIPTAMLEALASSLPVVTTNSGSITEVIDDGVEGLIVGQRDAKAYAEALERVITDPNLEQRMAEAARARFDKDFDTKVTEQRLHARIKGFLAGKVDAES